VKELTVQDLETDGKERMTLPMKISNLSAGFYLVNICLARALVGRRKEGVDLRFFG
jgi:hypothetical protein